MVQNLRSCLFQAAAYIDMGIYIRINSSFSKINHLKNGVFMQEFLRNVLIYVSFYEFCVSFCEICDFS